MRIRISLRNKLLIFAILIAVVPLVVATSPASPRADDCLSLVKSKTPLGSQWPKKALRGKLASGRDLHGRDRVVRQST